MAIEPLLTLQRALEEFIARIPERAEGTLEANELHRRVEVAFEHGGVDEPWKWMPETLRFVEEVNVPTVDQAEDALGEVRDLIRRGKTT